MKSLLTKTNGFSSGVIVQYGNTFKRSWTVKNTETHGVIQAASEKRWHTFTDTDTMAKLFITTTAHYFEVLSLIVQRGGRCALCSAALSSVGSLVRKDIQCVVVYEAPATSGEWQVVGIRMHGEGLLDVTDNLAIILQKHNNQLITNPDNRGWELRIKQWQLSDVQN